MRQLAYRAITESARITALIPADQWIGDGGMDITKPQTPFGVIKFAGDERSPSRHGVPRVEVWIHDDRGSYMRIDQILAAVRTELDTNVFAFPDMPGELICFDWQSYSPDLIDDGYNTNTRMAAFLAVGRSNNG